MPVWRCPHCATPQAEASRCWVCRRSTTSCVTCRHYRRSITGGLGLCGLDPRHPAVAATDVQPCWVGAPPSEAGVAVGPGSLDWLARDDAARPAGPHHRTFVPVDAIAPEPSAVAVLEAVTTPGLAPATGGSASAVQVPSPPAAARAMPGRWWLWGDPDPWPEG
jgi:hypothetical protein